MTTKNFSKMTTKKLNALLTTASEDDKKAIKAVLEAREQAQTSTAAATQNNPVEYQNENPLTAEEQAALEAAEKNGGINPMYNGSKSSQEKKPKMTDDERSLLAEKLKENIHHKCQVVPFNTVDWVDGFIAGVVEDKRSNKVLYAIKVNDGRRIVKVHDSNLLRIFEEVVEAEKKPRVHKAGKLQEKSEWSSETIAEEIAGVIGNVGKLVDFNKYHSSEVITGRIVAIVPDKRAQKLLYRIAVPEPTEENPNAVTLVHKMAHASELKIAEDFDEEGKDFNAKYIARRDEYVNRKPLTPQDRVLRCEENLKKAEEKLQKMQEEIEAKKKQLAEARKELDEYLKAEAESAEAASAETEPLA